MIIKFGRHRIFHKILLYKSSHLRIKIVILHHNHKNGRTPVNGSILRIDFYICDTQKCRNQTK